MSGTQFNRGKRNGSFFLNDFNSIFRFSAFVLLALGNPGVSSLFAQEDLKKQIAEDKRFLENHQIATDAEGLLAFFRKETLTREELTQIEILVGKLGSDSFKEREQASGKLIASGPKALSSLRKCMEKADPEIHQRAKHCSQSIQAKLKPDLYISAAHLLQEYKPAKACEVLFAYLPSAVNESVHEAILVALWHVGVEKNKVNPLLIKGLADEESTRRAVAALILGREGNLDQRKEVAKLLTDKESRVRFYAAQGLLTSQNNQGIPVLVELLREGHYEFAQKAEELLLLAAHETAPKAILAEDPLSRKQCFEVWQAWWQAQPRQLEWARVEDSLPWKNRGSQFRLVAQQFLKALFVGDLPMIEKTTDVPFSLGNGLLVFKTRQEFNQIMTQAIQGMKEKKHTAKIISVQSGNQYLKSAKGGQITYLKGLPLSEVFVVLVEVRYDQKMEVAALVMRRTAGQARVIAVLENN